MTRKWILVAPVALLLAAVVAPVSSRGSIDGRVGSPRLRVVHPPSGGFTIQVPLSWRFLDASYPSDHSTYMWFDPVNPLRRLIVTQDACAGCVAGVVDFRAMSQRKIKKYLPSVARIWIDGAYRVRFLSYSTDPWNVYPDNGLVAVQPPHHNVLTSRVHLWLPLNQRPLALRMLASFTPVITAAD